MVNCKTKPDALLKDLSKTKKNKLLIFSRVKQTLALHWKSQQIDFTSIFMLYRFLGHVLHKQNWILEMDLNLTFSICFSKN